jgi:hypothetical protein
MFAKVKIVDILTGCLEVRNSSSIKRIDHCFMFVWLVGYFWGEGVGFVLVD